MLFIPIVRKKPISKNSFIENNAWLISSHLGCLFIKAPSISAPSSPLIPTDSKKPYPTTKARNNPNNISNSSCPILSKILKIINFTGKIKSRKSASMVGNFISVKASKNAATISWIIRTATTSFPWKDIMSPLASSAFTANTVL